MMTYEERLKEVEESVDKLATAWKGGEATCSVILESALEEGLKDSAFLGGYLLGMINAIAMTGTQEGDQAAIKELVNKTHAHLQMLTRIVRERNDAG